jgi:hypothetical protein
MQVENTSGVHISLSDMYAYWNAFGYGDSEINTNPPFNKSDSHYFLICDNVRTTKLVVGKVIALETPTGHNYESHDETYIAYAQRGQ